MKPEISIMELMILTDALDLMIKDKDTHDITRAAAMMLKEKLRKYGKETGIEYEDE